jgi:hypothetical protein
MFSNYLRDDWHKQEVTHIRESRWFESMYTLQGETRPTRHVRFPCQSTYVRRTLPAGGPRTWQPFTKSSTAMDRAAAPEKKGSWHNPQRADWPIRGSTPIFSPVPAIEAVGVQTPSVGNQLLGLLGPYHQHAIGTFNTCSRGPTERSSINLGGGYSLGGAGLPHTHSPTFPNSCLHFPLMVPPGLYFNHVLATNLKCE